MGERGTGDVTYREVGSEYLNFGLALVLSPEEEFAVTQGVHGDPETEGYGVTEREERPPAAPM